MYGACRRVPIVLYYYLFIVLIVPGVYVMMLWIEKQKARSVNDLAHDFFVGGMFALCLVGGLL